MSFLNLEHTWQSDLLNKQSSDKYLVYDVSSFVWVLNLRKNCQVVFRNLV